MKFVCILLICFFSVFSVHAKGYANVSENGRGMIIETIPDGELSIAFDGADDIFYLSGTKVTYLNTPKENVTEDHIALYWCLFTLNAYSYSEPQTPQTILEWFEKGAQPPYNDYTYTHEIFQEENAKGLQIMFSDMIGIRLYVTPTQNDILSAEVEKITLLLCSPYTGALTMIEAPLQMEPLGFIVNQ